MCIWYQVPNQTSEQKSLLGLPSLHKIFLSAYLDSTAAGENSAFVQPAAEIREDSRLRRFYAPAEYALPCSIALGLFNEVVTSTYIQGYRS